MAQVNIINLPKTSEVNLSDFLILETHGGTKLLEFRNFTVDLINTTFEPLVSGHTTDITTNRTNIVSLTSDVIALSGLFDYNRRQAGEYVHTLSGLSIGTTSNNTKLTVNGNISATGSLSAIGTGRNFFGGNVGIGTYEAPHPLVVNTGGTNDVFRVNDDNNVGIELRSETAAGNPYIDFCNTSNDYDARITLSNTNRLNIENTNVGIRSTVADTTLYVGGSGTVGVTSTHFHPVTPSTSSDAHIYVKANKLILQYNDSGTVRYKYLALSGTGVSWVHTTDQATL